MLPSYAHVVRRKTKDARPNTRLMIGTAVTLCRSAVRASSRIRECALHAPTPSASARRVRAQAMAMAALVSHSSEGQPQHERQQQRYQHVRRQREDNHRYFSTSSSFKHKGRRPRTPPPLSSSASEPSPFQVLDVQTTATKDQIKQAFRKLAKQYHPDINLHNLSSAEAEQKMTQILRAYEQLLDDDIFARIGNSSRVALACEIYTIPELRLDSIHHVHALQVSYEDESESSAATGTSSAATALSMHPIFPITAHRDDSVSDLKRLIQQQFGQEWDLAQRRVDRDGIAFGWELVFCTNAQRASTLAHVGMKDASTEATSSSFDQVVLSYHLFLEDYGIQHNDILHAVVRKQDDSSSDPESR